VPCDMSVSANERADSPAGNPIAHDDIVAGE
jgi:hypothetical protein